MTRQSGTSLRGESPSQRGNKVITRVLFLSAFASINGDPASRAYDDKKRAEGKRHSQAIIALARCRSDILFATLPDGTFYESAQPNLLQQLDENDRSRPNMFFQLVASRYEQRSLLIASNLAFSRWGEIFTEDMVAALIN